MTSRVEMFGIEFDHVDMATTIDRVEQLARDGDGALVTTPNVDIVMRIQRDDEFRRVCRESPLVLADGMPVVWASRLLGTPLPERVAGADLFPLACERAAASGLSVFLFGAASGVADRAAAILQSRYPELNVCGTHSPPLGFDSDPTASAAAAAVVGAAAPDLLFLALGAPRQELWYDRHRAELNASVALGVGAAFDFVAGTSKRAPAWMQRSGLEWLHRLVQEPRRMFHRYVIVDSQFALLVLREWLGRRKGPSANVT